MVINNRCHIHWVTFSMWTTFSIINNATTANIASVIFLSQLVIPLDDRKIFRISHNRKNAIIASITIKDIYTSVPFIERVNLIEIRQYNSKPGTFTFFCFYFYFLLHEFLSTD